MGVWFQAEALANIAKRHGLVCGLSNLFRKHADGLSAKPTTDDGSDKA